MVEVPKENVGRYLFATGDEETRAWFIKQWSIWPVRADGELTTNIALHYDALLQYRTMHEFEPRLSRQFASVVAQLDRRRSNKPNPKKPILHIEAPVALSKRQQRRLRGKNK